MESKCHLQSKRPVAQFMKNKTKCMICENTVFKIRRITSQLIMLTCENCGGSQMIDINSDESG
jgi:translation initiation factor 2 beta subunit (eIF-2beta)/eIF-5